ncbi:MAG: hypothetical protein HQ582_00130 [Planctomycetes bacterium]|nr:hypothetical protein [Planctomycetota bacterium]
MRNGLDVTVEMVTQLRDDGFNPTWYGSLAWLEDRYGLRSEETGQDKNVEVVASRMHRTATDEAKPDDKQDAGGGERAIPLPDDTTFLKEMIRTLEREKSKEIERNEKREAKLFQQLEVKDKQISAWDEVTQGITKGLATGAIQPKLGSGMVPKDERQQGPESSAAPNERQVPEVIDATPAAPSKTAGGQKKQASSKQQPKASEKKKAVKTKAGKAAKGKPSAKNRAAPKKAPAKKMNASPKKADKRGFFSRLFR